MGLMRHRHSGTDYPLAGRTLIGRAPQCLIRFREGFVSREHAAIEHRDGAYWVKDLSPTGTRVNGRLVEPGACARIQIGDAISLGGGKLGPVLELTSDDLPQLVAHDMTVGTVTVAGTDGLLRLRSGDSAETTVVVGYRANFGAYLDAGSQGELVGDMVSDGKSVWVLHLPRDDKQTANLDPMPIDLRTSTLIVTTDEGADFVEIAVRTAESSGTRRAVVSRSRYATTLLVLAEKKQSDLDQGLPERHAGWVTNDELRSLLGCRLGEDENLPYLHPCRIKKLFEAANVRELNALFERDHGSLRLGVPRFEIAIR